MVRLSSFQVRKDNKLKKVRRPTKDFFLAFFSRYISFPLLFSFTNAGSHDYCDCLRLLAVSDEILLTTNVQHFSNNPTISKVTLLNSLGIIHVLS